MGSVYSQESITNKVAFMERDLIQLKENIHQMDDLFFNGEWLCINPENRTVFYYNNESFKDMRCEEFYWVAKKDEGNVKNYYPVKRVKNE